METKYGFSVGQKVVTLVHLEDENGKFIERGTVLRIVAITPKVTINSKAKYDALSDYEKQFKDRRQYFYNAIVADQTQPDYMNRIRADFVTVRKYKEPKSHTVISFK